MKKISMLVLLALGVGLETSAAAQVPSELSTVRTCLDEVRKHVNAEAQLGHTVRFEAKSTQVQALGSDSFVCLVVGTWTNFSHISVHRETRAYYAAVQSRPDVKSRVGLVAAL